jgi:hypothetical protein
MPTLFKPSPPKPLGRARSSASRPVSGRAAATLGDSIGLINWEASTAMTWRWPERDLEALYDHERAAKEFLDAADRIYSQANVGAIPLTST